jgi:hypothetical protein
MKKTLLALTAILYLILNYGYYNYIEDGEAESIFFEKKHLTLQVKFYNIYAGQSDHKKLSELTIEQREKIINYCKYRLGIITKLTNDDDLERCKFGNTPLHFRK